jgi:hypothetical protein
VRRWREHRENVGEGHLYQGRFKAFPVQSDAHLLDVLGYVEANPLRARMVARAQDWRWSSLGGGAGVDGKRVQLTQWPVARPAGWVERVNAVAGQRSAVVRPAQPAIRQPIRLCASPDDFPLNLPVPLCSYRGATMADGKARRGTTKKKKRKRRRRKFSSVSQARAQLEGITAAQERYRRAKRRRAKDKADATAVESERIIIESREKSEQAWKNALRDVHRPEDLDGFD